MTTHGFPYCLVVLRHGQSEWNAAGVFTGWENAHLTAPGELLDAADGADLLVLGSPRCPVVIMRGKSED